MDEMRLKQERGRWRRDGGGEGTPGNETSAPQYFR